MHKLDEILNKDFKYISDNLTKEIPRLSGKKVLITGGAGFLGYYLINTIVYWNENNTASDPILLTVYDNFSRGMPEWISKLEKKNKFNLISHNIVDPLPLDIPIFNYIIHAASIASPIIYRKYPIETMDANTIGLRRLLDYSLKNSENITATIAHNTNHLHA